MKRNCKASSFGIIMPVVAVCMLVASTARGELECRKVQTIVTGPAQGRHPFIATCGESETLTGGSCEVVERSVVVGRIAAGHPSDALDAWECELPLGNTIVATTELIANAICCKVPVPAESRGRAQRRSHRNRVEPR